MTPELPLTIQPIQWLALPELADCPELDDSDLACLGELREVLARHGKLARFAVHLAHRHFELRPGEVVVEQPDAATRTQTVTVGRLEAFPDARPTTWLFGDRPSLQLSAAVYCVCQPASVHSSACAVHARSPVKSQIGQEQDRLAERNYQEQEARKKTGWPVAGHGERER